MFPDWQSPLVNDNRFVILAGYESHSIGFKSPPTDLWPAMLTRISAMDHQSANAERGQLSS
jgi:hypothetical protein